MKRHALFLAACLVLATAASLPTAPLQAAPAADAPEGQAAPAIATRADVSEDADIAARIRDIFGQIAVLHDVGCACPQAS